MAFFRKYFLHPCLVFTIAWTALVFLVPSYITAEAAPMRDKSAGSSINSGDGRVVLVVIDRITWEDFQAAGIPEIKKLAARGAIGLMTTNPAAGFPRVPANTYATIGAGHKVGGGPAGGAGFNADEEYENDTAGDAYYRRTGVRVPPSSIVHLGIADIERVNLGLKYDYTLGTIGTILHENGIKTAVIGNADVPVLKTPEERYRRQAVLIAMDRLGRVDFGDVSDKNQVFTPDTLAGISTNYDRILSKFDNLKSRAGFIVIETGDTSRIDQLDLVTMDEALKQARIQALASIDRFVGKLLQRLDLNRDLVMIVTPGPPSEAMANGNFLTPFVIAGRGIPEGVVWSGTTKRRGLIANTDIAATVTRHFGLTEYRQNTYKKDIVVLNGRNIEVRESDDPFGETAKLGENAVFLYNSRYPLVKTYINLELAVVIITVAGLILRKKFVKYTSPLLLAFTVIPVVMLGAGFLPRPSLGIVVLEILAITAVITLAALAAGRQRALNPYAVTAGLTVGAILTDLAFGGPMAKNSPFSYDVMTGARFYGLGNEYMGVLLGAVISAAGIGLDMLKNKSIGMKLVIAALFAAVIYFIAAPDLGTNVGGTMAAVAGLGTAGLLMFGWKINKKNFTGLLLAIAIVLAGLIVYDLSRSVEAQSHIGRTAALIAEGGFDEITTIIARKLEMNLKLIKKTSWTWFYFVCLLSFYLLGKKLPHEFKRFREKNSWFNKMLTATVICSIFALLFNDSGVVAAATMIIFATAPFLTGIIRESFSSR